MSRRIKHLKIHMQRPVKVWTITKVDQINKELIVKDNVIYETRKETKNRQKNEKKRLDSIWNKKIADEY